MMIEKIRFAYIKFSAMITKFFFEPASARPLAALRVGLSSLLLWQAFLMYEGFRSFFASSGFVQKEVSSLLNNPNLPRLNWLIDLYSHLGLNESEALGNLGFIYIISLLFLLFGLFTRPMALISWFLNWSFLNTGYSGAYGADLYIHIFLFYLMLVPAGHAYSLDCLLRKASEKPSYQARLGLRVLQLHMCISYLASGLEKASGAQWWNGEIIFIALNTPGYQIIDSHWMADFSFIPMVMGWLVLAVEIFYAIFIWPAKTRTFWISATCLLHIGIAIFLRLHVFGLLMCIPTIALFAFAATPRPRTATQSQSYKIFARNKA